LRHCGAIARYAFSILADRWAVVEQTEHVKVGKKDFEDESLRFHFSIDEVLAAHKPDVLLVSGVLHFMEHPEDFLRTLLSPGIPSFILDRTPLRDHDRHRLTVQHVPPEIYEASYPAWFLSKQRILRIIEEKYTLRWRAPDTETWELDQEPVPNALWCFETHGGHARRT
jgi:putative methyltransferase (TIGR04325 family)